MARKVVPTILRPASSSLFLAGALLIAIFILLVSNPPSFPRVLLRSNDSDYRFAIQRPLIVYTKPRKTGSTFISSMLGNAVLRAGGRVAPCSITSFITPNAPYYGLVRSYDLLGCHRNLTAFSFNALRSLNREIVFVTSTREPMSWFLSAAVWVYEIRTHVRVQNASLLQHAIDYALDGGEEYVKFRSLFLSNHGLTPSSPPNEITDIINIYTYVFDHDTAEEDVNRALLDLGYSTSRASSRREGVYNASWVAGYRTDDIRRATNVETILHERLMAVRKARLDQHAGWADPNAKQVKTRYSAAGIRRPRGERPVAKHTNSITV